MAKKNYRIFGKIIDLRTQQGLAELRVEAWDKDLILDDLVGSAVTDEQGAFQKQFTESHFKELFLDRKPDLFFKVFQDDKLLKSTEDSVLWNVGRETKDIVIEVKMPGNGEVGNFRMSGHIVEPDGSGVESIAVKAFHVELRAENLLGEATSDNAGQYLIRYARDQLSSPDKTSAACITRFRFFLCAVLVCGAASVPGRLNIRRQSQI